MTYRRLKFVVFRFLSFSDLRQKCSANGISKNKCIYHHETCNRFWGVLHGILLQLLHQRQAIYLSCCHLYSFASYHRPYDLIIKYPVTWGYQFLSDVVFACCYMKGLARLQYHSITRIVQIVLQGGFLAVFFTFPSFHSVCCIIPPPPPHPPISNKLAVSIKPRPQLKGVWNK